MLSQTTSFFLKQREYDWDLDYMPNLWANAFSEVMNPFFQLHLPTLFHWLEVVQLGALMLLWVWMGMNDTRPSKFSRAAPYTTWGSMLF